MAALAVALAAPLAASAGCPGCEEYTLDIPDDEGDEPAPAPAPAPIAAPAAPVPTTTVPVVPTVPTAPAPEKDPKPVDTDPDPVPDGDVKPPAVESIPAVAATQASSATDAGTDGGVVPLAIALGAIAIVGLALGFGRRPES